LETHPAPFSSRGLGTETGIVDAVSDPAVRLSWE